MQFWPKDFCILKSRTMKPISKRMIIYPKDVMNITGKGPRTSRYIIFNIKKKKGIPLVTVEAFCEYMKLKEEDVKEYLANN